MKQPSITLSRSNTGEGHPIVEYPEEGYGSHHFPSGYRYPQAFNTHPTYSGRQQFPYVNAHYTYYDYLHEVDWLTKRLLAGDISREAGLKKYLGLRKRFEYFSSPGGGAGFIVGMGVLGLFVLCACMFLIGGGLNKR